MINIWMSLSNKYYKGKNRPTGTLWIPHRPVLKLANQTTVKVRPVLNCSCKGITEIGGLSRDQPNVGAVDSLQNQQICFVCRYKEGIPYGSPGPGKGL